MSTELSGTHEDRALGRLRLRRALRAGLAPAPLVLLLIALLAACGSSAPGVANLGATPKPSSTPGGSHSALAFAQCMRKHGVTNFPDPGSGGRIAINGSEGGGLDPASSQFQNAQQACRSLLPNGGAPNPQQQQQMQQDALKFSQCMRAHGIANFPDPQFQSGPGGGGVTLQLPPGIDAESQQFKDAQQACQSQLPKPPGGSVSTGGPGAGAGGGPSTNSSGGGN